LWIEAEFELIGRLRRQLVGGGGRPASWAIRLLDSGSYILNAIGAHDLSPAWVVDAADQLRDQPPGERARCRGGRARSTSRLVREGRRIPCALVRLRTGSCSTRPDPAAGRLPSRSPWRATRSRWASRTPSRTSGPARHSGSTPAPCVVFEDSETGARSGNAAGALVIACRTGSTSPPAPRRVHDRITHRARRDLGRRAAGRRRCPALADIRRIAALGLVALALAGCRTTGESPTPTPGSNSAPVHRSCRPTGSG
jgi:hypothetical protein